MSLDNAGRCHMLACLYNLFCAEMSDVQVMGVPGVHTFAGLFLC